MNCATLPGADEEPAPDFPGELIDVGSHTLFVRRGPVVPDAPTLLYVHGLGGQGTNWTDLMTVLSPSTTGVAVDLPGFGHSPGAADDDYSLAAHASAVIAVARTLPGPVHLVGNSLGGAISTVVAAAEPDLVASLTLLSPALPDALPRRDAALMPALTLPGIGPALWRRSAATPAERRLADTMAVCYADPSVLHPTRWQQGVDEIQRRDGLPWAEKAFTGSLRSLVGDGFFAFGESNLWRRAASVTAPTLAVFGTADRLVAPRVGRYAQRIFHDVRVVVLDRIGHVAMMEVPQVVAGLMVETLLDPRGTSASDAVLA